MKTLFSELDSFFPDILDAFSRKNRENYSIQVKVSKIIVNLDYCIQRVAEVVYRQLKIMKIEWYRIKDEIGWSVKASS